jgi:hypothetical protein
MFEFFIGVVCFSAGFFSGSYFKSLIIGSQDWKVMRWNSDIFGYRKVPPGYKIQKNEDVFMCLKMDTEDVPEDGLEVQGESW